VLAFRDISARLATEEQLEHQAFHDALTGFAEPPDISRPPATSAETIARSNEVHTVLFVDVDRFKMTNDSLGHLAGDELLKAIADRLRGVARDEDTLARLAVTSSRCCSRTSARSRRPSGRSADPRRRSHPHHARQRQDILAA